MPESWTQSRPEVLDSVEARRGELGATLAHLKRAMDAAGHAATWRSDVGAAMMRLREDLHTHVVLAEGPGGLHEQVLGDAPRLAGRVGGLQREHFDLQLAVDEALHVLAERPSVGSRRLQTMIMGLVDRLEKHRRRGADLVYEAYQVDLGAGD